MLKKIALLASIVFTTYFLYNGQIGTANSFQPPVGNAGAGAGQQSCTGSNCHGNASNVNSGPGSLELNFANNTQATFDRGGTYDISLTVNDETKSRFGFEMVAFDGDGNSVGEFIANNSAVTVRNADGIEYISHFEATNPNNNTFDFQWKAPEEDIGSVNFHFSANAANGNSQGSGDNIYSSSHTVDQTLDTGFETLMASAISVGPNPVRKFINIGFELTETENAVSVDLQDLSGRTVQQLFNEVYQANKFEHQFEVLNDLSSGLYILKIAVNDQSIGKKIIVQR